MSLSLDTAVTITGRHEVIVEDDVVYLIDSAGTILRLSRPASAIWRLTDNRASVASLTAAHARASAVPWDVALEAVEEFVEWAREIGAMDIRSVGEAAASGVSLHAAGTHGGAPSPSVDVPQLEPPPYWRTEAKILRGFFSTAVVESFDVNRFFSWAHAPATARLYMRTEEDRPGSARAGSLPDPAQARGVYELYREEGKPVTILLHRTERAGRELECLRDALPQGPRWQRGDIVATLSSPGSSIGFHAGVEDGYVVQLRGTRHWRVWDSSCLPDAYVRSLLGEGEDERVDVPARPDLPPLVDCRLAPGDVLYIPALMPHEGITMEESISLSIAWRGLSPYYVLMPLVDFTSTEVEEATVARPDAFFRLIPDPADGVSVASFLHIQVSTALDALGDTAPSRRRVLDYLGRLAGELPLADDGTRA